MLTTMSILINFTLSSKFVFKVSFKINNIYFLLRTKRIKKLTQKIITVNKNNSI